jgi:hypothetical protein
MEVTVAHFKNRILRQRKKKKSTTNTSSDSWYTTELKRPIFKNIIAELPSFQRKLKNGLYMICIKYIS